MLAYLMQAYLCPFVSTCDTTLFIHQLRFSTLLGGQLLTKRTGSGLKGNRLMHLLCKFQMRGYPWQVMLT